jgi:hypothetical protein
MANLAQLYLKSGFYKEADAEIKRGRISEDPDENVGSAMVALAQARKNEKKRWTDERRLALGHKKFFDELADALVSDSQQAALAGPWQVGKSTTITLQIAGSAAEAAWQDSGSKRRFHGTTVGRALLGLLEEWNVYFDRFDTKGTLALVLREDGSLSGILVSSEGALKTVEWGKAG